MAQSNYNFPKLLPFYCQKVLPLIYDNSLSYYEVLCKLADYMKELSASQDAVWDFVQGIDDVSKEWPEYKEQMNQMFLGFETNINQQIKDFETDWQNWQTGQGKDYQDFIKQVQDDMQTMADTIDAIKSGAYLDLYLEPIKKYIDANLQKFVAGLVTYVTFGLTNDGHFAAYIPPNWQFVKFGTITDPESPLYKHLTLSW